MSLHRLPLLMGVINVTPDSFSDGGAYLEPARAIERGIELAEQGAAILDVGGESTRPGAEDEPAAVELARVIPVVKGLAGRTAAAISIDTRKPEVARAAACTSTMRTLSEAAVARLSGAWRRAETSFQIAAPAAAAGPPKTMQDDPRYADVVSEVEAFLRARVAACIDAGIPATRLILDPGIGFGKTADHNLALLAATPRLGEIGPPLLIGASRKRFIAAIEERAGWPAAAPGGRIGGSLAVALAAARAGAAILRVHDVAETRQALAVAAAIEKVAVSR